MPYPQVFLSGCLAMMAGVGAASMISISRFLFWVLAAAAVFLFFAGLAAKNHKIAVAGILSAAFVLGFWRFDAAWQKTVDNGLTKLNGQTVEVAGTVVRDPVLKDSSQQIILRPDGIEGNIMVLARRYPEYVYGDKIRFIARLEAPQNFSDFDYKNYLAKDGIYAMARWPEIELVSENNGNPIYAELLRSNIISSGERAKACRRRKIRC